MSNHLVRITQNDYRDYRRTYSQINYSFSRKGEQQLFPAQVEFVRKMASSAILGKGEFLDFVEKKENELYFFKDDDKILGIVVLIFTKNECKIHEFAVLEPLKGLGSELYDLVENVIRAHSLRNVLLFCPFEGAQVFWKKKGFSPIFQGSSGFEKRLK